MCTCELYTCMYMVCVWVYTSVRVSSCVWLCCSDSDLIERSELVTEDPDSIRICVRRVPIRQAIRRPTYESTRRSVSVRTMQTRQRFGPETASFHLTVCFCVICLFTVVNEYLCFTRIISCEHLIYIPV